MKISNESMIAAYEVAKRIRAGKLSRSAGIEELHQRFGLNRGSAGDTINNIGYMLNGKRYARTNNAFATEHFLEMISRDYGLDSLRKAISSVEKHIKYYQALPRGSKLANISQIIRKYHEIANDQTENLGDDEAHLAGANCDTDFVPMGEDRRKVVERQIRERRGQQQFRDALRRRYGDCCLVTGCEVLSVLEAAHISPYCGEDDNHAANGLLLRADVHTLFDLDLIGIEPDGLRIEIHPAIAKEYGAFAGGILRCRSRQRPAQKALSLRYEKFRKRSQTGG